MKLTDVEVATKLPAVKSNLAQVKVLCSLVCHEFREEADGVPSLIGCVQGLLVSRLPEAVEFYSVAKVEVEGFDVGKMFEMSAQMLDPDGRLVQVLHSTVSVLRLDAAIEHYRPFFHQVKVEKYGLHQIDFHVNGEFSGVSQRLNILRRPG